MFGAATAYIIARSPPGNETLKGAGVGAALWMTTLSLGNLLWLDHLTRIKAAQMASLFAASVFFAPCRVRSWAGSPVAL